jgi:hypothetical protein
MAIFSCRVVPKHDGAGRRDRVLPGTMASLCCRAVNPARGVWDGNLRRWAAASSSIGRVTSASKPRRDQPWERDIRRQGAANPSRGGRPLPPGLVELRWRGAVGGGGGGAGGRGTREVERGGEEGRVAVWLRVACGEIAGPGGGAGEVGGGARKVGRSRGKILGLKDEGSNLYTGSNMGS